MRPISHQKTTGRSADSGPDDDRPPSTAGTLHKRPKKGPDDEERGDREPQRESHSGLGRPC